MLDKFKILKTISVFWDGFLGFLGSGKIVSEKNKKFRKVKRVLRKVFCRLGK
ncbi:MAG: hypothetical protein ACPGJS_17350 [Flammeovirgaceae bacterium]